MNLAAFREGLEILSKYYDDPDGYPISASYDQLWMSATDRPLSDVDVARMYEIGWMQDESIEEKAPYDPEETWTCYL